MDVLDQKPALGGGAAGRGAGSLYHLSFRSGSRASGASARASYEYVTREGEYGGPAMDPAVYTESDHMPSWAEGDPVDYWVAADLYERDNGRLYVSADLSLPRDLTAEDQIALASEFAHELTDEEGLPYTLAIHAGRNEDGKEHNPHAHLMFSERKNDGIERSREQWFRRANSIRPERGGAPKSRTFHGREWVERARAKWADKTNAMLERRGRGERVDHRSYDRQGIARNPGSHYGPSAAYIAGRGAGHDRLEEAMAVGDDAKALATLDGEIARLEAIKESLLREGPEDSREAEPPRDYSHSSGGGARGDQSWER